MNVFRVWPLRFYFEALTDVTFPPNLATNTIRGALGIQLRNASCIPECSAPQDCPIQQVCAYATIFEPQQHISILSQARRPKDLPRPFVVRASKLDGLKVKAGQTFSFDLNLFLPPQGVLPFLIIAFRRLAESGLGIRGGKAFLSSVDSIGLDGEPVAKAFNGQAITYPNPISFALKHDQLSTDVSMAVSIRFTTPTEIKADGKIETTPTFHNVFNRAMDRVAALARIYQAEPIELDFNRLSEHALSINEQFAEWSALEVLRRSTKTGQRHGLGGSLGRISVYGKLKELLPILIAGQYCGVGRHTAWGNGAYRIEA
jgi:hypothetical protein